jgi:hypothetical protein
MSNWQDDRSKTADQFVACLKSLGLSQAAASRYLGLSERQVYRMVHGHAPVPTPVCLLLNAMIHHNEKPVVPKRRHKKQGVSINVSDAQNAQT